MQKAIHEATAKRRKYRIAPPPWPKEDEAVTEEAEKKSEQKYQSERKENKRLVEAARAELHAVAAKGVTADINAATAKFLASVQGGVYHKPGKIVHIPWFEPDPATVQREEAAARRAAAEAREEAARFAEMQRQAEKDMKAQETNMHMEAPQFIKDLHMQAWLDKHNTQQQHHHHHHHNSRQAQQQQDAHAQYDKGRRMKVGGLPPSKPRVLHIPWEEESSREEPSGDGGLSRKRHGQGHGHSEEDVRQSGRGHRKDVSMREGGVAPPPWPRDDSDLDDTLLLETAAEAGAKTGAKTGAKAGANAEAQANAGVRARAQAEARPEAQASFDNGYYIGEGAFPLEDQFPIADAMPIQGYPLLGKVPKPRTGPTKVRVR